MKKILNFNFVTVAILAAVLILAAVIVGCGLSDVFTGVEKAGSEVYSYIEDGEVDDVEGWGFIFGGAAVGVAALFAGATWFVLVLVPAVLAIFMIIPAIIARLIYRTDKGRILVYRILMFFSYVWMGVLAFFLGTIIFGGKLTVATFIILVLFLYTIVVTVLGIRNTYTGRIRGEVNETFVEKTEDY